MIIGNLGANGCISFDSYIKPQPLHINSNNVYSCISFDSYIKPQRLQVRGQLILRCISFDSYIKPQPDPIIVFPNIVVYLLIPTSNHNYIVVYSITRMLYIF